jgi:hypothetical protein
MSEYSIYFLVRPAEVPKLPKKIPKERLIPCPGKKWTIVVTEDPVHKHVDTAIDFCNSEWTSWQFTLYHKGKKVLSGLFGENLEAGVAAEDNYLRGDVDAAAKVLGLKAAKLREVLTSEDPRPQAFADLVGFDITSTSPAEFE